MEKKEEEGLALSDNKKFLKDRRICQFNIDTEKKMLTQKLTDRIGQCTGLQQGAKLLPWRYFWLSQLGKGAAGIHWPRPGMLLNTLQHGGKHSITKNYLRISTVQMLRNFRIESPEMD